MVNEVSTNVVQDSLPKISCCSRATGPGLPRAAACNGKDELITPGYAGLVCKANGGAIVP